MKKFIISPTPNCFMVPLTTTLISQYHKKIWSFSVLCNRRHNDSGVIPCELTMKSNWSTDAKKNPCTLQTFGNQLTALKKIIKTYAHTQTHMNYINIKSMVYTFLQ